MNKQFLLFLFAVVVAFSCNRCKEECDDPTNPECPNYIIPVDPCEGKSEVSADFTIEERVSLNNGDPIWRESEGILFSDIFSLNGSNWVRVIANHDDLNYKWIIGSDTIYDQQYTFHFAGAYCCQTIPIKLIVEGQIDSTCFPNDNGMDTLVKGIQLGMYYNNPVIGRYKVAWDSAPMDSFEVQLDTVYFLGDFNYDIYAHNFQNEQSDDSCLMSVAGSGYKFLKLRTDLSGCLLLRGEFWLNVDNSFEALYQMDNTPDNGWSVIGMPYFHARGRRIN